VLVARDSFNLDTSTSTSSGDFTSACASPRGHWIYTVSEDGKLHCFKADTGDLERTIVVESGEVMGVGHHPHRNLVATFGKEGILKLWKA
jgi:WD40 repeat-containing protein SMU1